MNSHILIQLGGISENTKGCYAYDEVEDYIIVSFRHC